MNILVDYAAEKGVISGLLKYGQDAFLDISGLINADCFQNDSHCVLYKCIALSFDKSESVDIASIFSAAKELDLDRIVDRLNDSGTLKPIVNFPVDKNNVQTLAIKLRKLSIARDLYNQMDLAKEQISEITGSENINQILSIAEDAVFNFTSSLNDDNNEPCKINSGIEEYLKELEENPVDQIGIPTGFPIYDTSIGGGLRRSTINVIAARPKTGKTLLVDNMSYNISKSDIPVLNLDTEMTKEDHVNRLLALSTEVPISDIENGKFSQSIINRQKIKEASKSLKDNLYYHSIAGKSFEEQLSLMRRWVTKTVGLNKDGSAKDCVIFYDYLKLMDSQGMSQDMKEYQVLGFMMTSLHNFACKYKIPIVTFVQLNRDGITKESTDTVSGSDRIIWLCSNFTVFKRKTDEEIAEDGAENGNRKLIPIISRHGAGLDDNDYINCNMKGWCAKIQETRTRIDLLNNVGNNTKDSFTIEDDEPISFI